MAPKVGTAYINRDSAPGWAGSAEHNGIGDEDVKTLAYLVLFSTIAVSSCFSIVSVAGGDDKPAAIEATS